MRGIDSVWTPLVEYLAALGDTYDAKEALKRQEATTGDAWEYARLHVQKTLGHILTPIQLQLLPWLPKLLYFSKEPVRIRMFMG